MKLTSAIDVAISSPMTVSAPILVVDLEQAPVLGTILIGTTHGGGVRTAFGLNQTDPVGKTTPGDSLLH